MPMDAPAEAGQHMVNKVKEVVMEKDDIQIILPLPGVSNQDNL